MVYSKVDPQLVNPTFLLRTPSGDLTGNYGDFSQLWFDAWMPIFDKFSNQSKPFWATFYERYHQYFENPCKMSLRPFTTNGLRKKMKKMNIRSGTGPDFWSVSDLTNLPDSIFFLLPAAFELIE